MNRSAVEQIKERLPIEDVLGSYIKLEKAGKSFKAKCPFHNEKSASFFVSPDRGGYYCFGCNAKGDIFTFVEQFEGLDFRGALKVLAEKAGVQLVADSKADSEKDRLFQIMDQAAQFFETQMEKSAEAKKYITDRGITAETRKQFRIGWAPEGWRNLLTYLKSKGWNESIIEKVGLIKKAEREEQVSSPNNSGVNYYDRFRGRIMFPIMDSSGRVIAFSGRILKSDADAAKYLNSPDMPLYDKSAVLYGLDKAKAEIRRLSYTILVEGQMDLVMSHQAGIKNTVAASGTALSDASVTKEGIVNNLGLIRRLSPNLIIAFDSDAAGRKAALRAAGIALSINMDVKIADIVGGKDPADLVKENAELWKQTLREAKHVVEFELDSVLRETTDPRKLPRALQERVYPLLLNIEKSTDREYFVRLIKDRAHIASTDVIWEDLNVLSKRQQQESAKNSANLIKPVTRTSSEISKRIDLVERRLFGLLKMMEGAAVPEVQEFKAQIQKIAGNTYEERVTRIEPIESDVLFEAESVFGEDLERWKFHMKELLLNFEEDVINEEIVLAMQELRAAEKAGNSALVGELATKCQRLSIRKAELGKSRK